MNRNVRGPLWQGVANLVCREYLDPGEPILPGVGQLARRYQVSRRTILQALRVLRTEGKVAFARGSRVRNATSPVPEEAEVVVSWEKLYRQLRSDIAFGVLAAGTQLPKAAFMAQHHHLSPTTVRKAYRMLAQEGSAERAGRSYRVGRTPRRRVAGAGFLPTVLVVARNANAWRDIATSERTASFGQTFVGEAEKWKVRLLLVSDQPDRRYREQATTAELTRAIDSLGAAYRGALVAGASGEIADLERLVGDLVRAGRPVVWLDRNDDGGARFGRGKTFARAGFSERLCLSAAVEFLRERGHRHVMYHTPQPGDWQLRRGELVREIGAGHPEPIDVTVHSELPGASWREPGAAEPVAQLAELLAIGPPLVRRAIKRFSEDGTCAPARDVADIHLAGVVGRVRDGLSGAPGSLHRESLRNRVFGAMAMLPLLRNRSISAVVACNDLSAVSRTLPHMHVLQLRVPRDISVLGIDNAFRLTFYPLTTVDPGFGSLGYQSFHFILGDIPVSRDANGTIAPLCAVVDRGTVGAVR